jgi:two-component system sensor histidine kinase TtrS
MVGLIPRHLLLLLLVLLTSSTGYSSDTEDVRIGVLSHRGDTATSINWSATAEYLSHQLPAYRFHIVPLDFDEIEAKILDRAIDFILVNPSIYVEMEVRHQITRIATLSRVVNDRFQNRFGGVLFTSSSNSQIQSLDDIRYRHLMAVDRKSLGGFQMVARELAERGIEVGSDLKVSFAGIHDDVVRSVLAGEAELGTVRTGILESMARSGEVKLSDIRVLNRQSIEGFSQLLSTRLYPEWPFSKLPHTSDMLAQDVAIALMNMPALPEPQENGVIRDRWTIPLEYQPVHELLKSLRLPPYDVSPRFTFVDALRKYWYVIVTTLVILALLVVITLLVIRLNRELKKSNKRLARQHALILDSVADGIYGVDLDGNSTFVNKAMEKITGWSSQSLIGKNQHDLLHHTRINGEHHPVEECPVYQTFRDQQSRFIEDDLFWRSDGSSFPVEYSTTPLRDENNHIIGSVVIFRDISERKKAKEQAHKLRNELAHMARINTMGEMASGIAHELNQPLTAISTSADACIRFTESTELDKNQLSDTLEEISVQAKRSGAIIQQLRNFIRKEVPEKSPVNLNDIIREVLPLLERSLKENLIQLELQLSDQVPTVQVQRIQIDQVIFNLVKNAIEAMSDEQVRVRNLTITTRYSVDNNQVRVMVSDTGGGIDESIRKRLFTPFSTSKQSGMGIGLSLSQGIVHEHGGELVLLNSSSQGASFQFTLPLSGVS